MTTLVQLKPKSMRATASIVLLFALAACSPEAAQESIAPETTPLSSKPIPQPKPPTLAVTDAFASKSATARFLTQATFGPTPNDLNTLTGTNVSEWILAEFDKQPSFLTPQIKANSLTVTPRDFTFFDSLGPTFAFWNNAIASDDQLRQRMAFALSQLVVVSAQGSDDLDAIPEAMGYYQDLLVTHAFGNYRDLLEDVTYSPAMGGYLTYDGNQKADPATGRMPDENYAREILQLFTLGLVELNLDGSEVIGGDGKPVELYDNFDITELAKVFTGLVRTYEGEPWTFVTYAATFELPMVIDEDFHSQLPKRFLGLEIPVNTDAATSIDMALDHIMAHPNIGPFISRQLIQRFVTSDPEPDYIARVATAFNNGSYVLPNGTFVGTGQKGDLKATIAAILLDEDARKTTSIDPTKFGKIREPIMRVTNWARAFDAGPVTPELMPVLWSTGRAGELGQHPYRARSVFNFYRPGYVAPGTLSGAEGMTVPELQITNASTTPSYANYIYYYVASFQQFADVALIQEFFDGENISIDPSDAPNVLNPDYTTEIALAGDPVALMDHLDTILTYNTMNQSTKDEIISALNNFPYEPSGPYTAEELRVILAVQLVIMSPDFLVQR